MRRILYFLCFLNCFPLYSQELFPLNEKKYTDSLQQVIKGNTNSLSKRDAYFILSDYYRNTAPPLSKKYLENGRKSGEKDPITAALYSYYEGQYYFDLDKEKAAVSYQKAIEALSKFKGKKSDFYKALSWYSYGITLKNKEGYPYCIKIMLEKSIPAAEPYGETQMLGYLYTQLSLMLTYNAEFEKAESYNTQAIHILEKKAPHSTELFYAYLSRSGNYSYQAKGSVGKKFLDQAEKMILPYPESSANASYFYHKALYFITQQENKKALEAVERGLSYTKKFNMKLLMQMFYFQKYDTYKKLKKYKEAKELLEYVLAEKTLGMDLNNRKTIYSHLSSLNEFMGDPVQALAWEKKYSKLSDSLHTENVKLEINKLEAKFNASEKEKKIALLNAEKKQKQLEVNKKNYYLWVLSLALLFLISLLTFLFVIYTNSKKLSEQKEINLQQKIEDIKQKEELALTKAILEGEERERERVAKDLHDGLGGMLAGVKINLSTWSSTHLDPEQHKDFYKILHQLDHSVAELRHVARNLMPESLFNFGLETALNDLCEFYTRNDLDICFQSINIEKNIPLTIQLNIYRIVQELLANAVKHAQASSILLQCSQSGDSFMITVEDNGKGFEKNSKNNIKSMGFRNLRNRVNYLKGKMEVSSDSQGTTINIELTINGE